MMTFFLIVGIALFVGSLFVETNAAPAPVGEAALPPSLNERIWAAMRIAGVVLMSIGLCGVIIVARAGF